MNRWVKSVLAVLFGVFAFTFLSFAFEVWQGDSSHRSASLAEFAANVAFALVGTAMAAYVAAGVAGWNEKIHGLITGLFLGWGMGSPHFAFEGVADGWTHLLALVTLPFAGIAGGALRGLVMDRRRQSERATWVEGLPPLPLRIAPPRPLIWFSACLALGLAAAAAFAVSKQWEPQASIKALMVFGAGGLFFLYRAVFYGPNWTVDSDGITFHRLGNVTIPWADILGAKVKTLPPFDLVYLDVRDGERYLLSASAAQRALIAGSKEHGGSHFAVNTAQSGLDSEIFSNVVRREIAMRGSATRS